MEYITDEDYLKAEQNGIKRPTVRSRVMEFGWDVEKAITTPPKKFIKIPPQILREIKKNNISIATYRGRIKLGWSIKRASSEPPGKPGPRPKNNTKGR